MGSSLVCAMTGPNLDLPTSHVQQDQPQEVSPLALTGERTLPDVPEENYWFRRHLVVYEWIASQLAGRKVVDLACGEGYGSSVLARTAESVVGVDANPEAFDHARKKYTAPNLSFERSLIETWQGDADCIVFLQTIEHLQDASAMLAHIRTLIDDNGVAYISTPNVLTLAPPGETKSDNPWHVHEFRPDEFYKLCTTHFGKVDVLGLYHARKLRIHQLAIEKLAWDRVHSTLGMTKRFYKWFVPAITTQDFSLRAGELQSSLDLIAVLQP